MEARWVPRFPINGDGIEVRKKGVVYQRLDNGRPLTIDLHFTSQANWCASKQSRLPCIMIWWTSGLHASSQPLFIFHFFKGKNEKGNSSSFWAF